jgi:hypothetical protein
MNFVVKRRSDRFALVYPHNPQADEFCVHRLNCFAVIVSARFPHFHSDGYYYCLYPHTKTGYSNSSKLQFCERLPAEEIQQWNSV